MWLLISTFIGIVLDFILGDPEIIPHPVIFIGKLISQSEKFLRQKFPKTSDGERKAGLIIAIFVPVFCFIISALILYTAYKINFYLWFCLNTFWSFQIPAARCLAKESSRVFKLLEKDDIEGARIQLSFLVGRETSELSKEEIIKATVETVAENTSDGVTAPILYMMIGGVPLGFFYKAVNTLDSMIGYRNEKYEYFGKCSAKLDDIMNFIPSRICGILMILSSFVCGENLKNALKIFKRDRKNHLSPNSAQTESVAAGALEIQLGGAHKYFGKIVEKPLIGDDIKSANNYDIIKMNKMMLVTDIITTLIAVGIIFLWRFSNEKAWWRYIFL